MVADDPPIVRYTSCTPAADWGSPSLRLAAKLLAAHNRERSKRHLPLLLSDPALTRAAHGRRCGWLPGTKQPRRPQPRWDDTTHLAGQAHRLRLPSAIGAGENIAWYRPRTTDAVKINTIIAGWLRSPGHRANLLNPEWHAVGIGVAVTPSTVTYGRFRLRPIPLSTV